MRTQSALRSRAREQRRCPGEVPSEGLLVFASLATFFSRGGKVWNHIVTAGIWGE